MPDKLIYKLIEKMHLKLNELIANCNYDLTNPKVLKYSRRLDRMILRYSKARKMV